MCEGLEVGWFADAVVGFDVSCVEGCIDKVCEDGRDEKTFNSGIFVDRYDYRVLTMFVGSLEGSIQGLLDGLIEGKRVGCGVGCMEEGLQLEKNIFQFSHQWNEKVTFFVGMCVVGAQVGCER